LVAALLLVPFFHKAYTIDDPIFLSGAAQVLRDPLHPAGFTMAWMTDYPAPASLFFSNSPLMFYLLAPVIAAGGAEWMAHLLILGFFCAGIWGTISLGLRLGLTSREAAWSGILLAATPAALALASTDMPDIPAMTFGVLAVDRLTAWKQSRRWRDAMIGALLLSLAALSRSHMIVLTVVCLIWLCEPGAKGRWHVRFWPLLFPPAIFALTLHLTAGQATGGIFQATRSFTSVRLVPSNLLAYLTQFVWVLPLTIPWLLSRRLNWVRLACTLVPACAIAMALRNVVAWFVVPLAFLTAFVLIDILRSAVAERNWMRLFLAAWLLLPLPALGYIHLPAKYLVPCAPAVALLLVAGLRSATARLRVAILIGATAAGIVMGVLIIRADYNLAGTLRQGVAQLIAPRTAGGERVWFSGTWGFYWYAERAGARPLSSVPPLPLPGDILVTCSTAGKAPAGNPGLRYRRIQHVADSTPGGRIFGGHPSAGFYSNYWGYLPWSWGRDPLATFDVWRVE
jgi:4-amino-4-deoxy-L-arabinose transferase-like glycosyltransferase